MSLESTHLEDAPQAPAALLGICPQTWPATVYLIPASPLPPLLGKTEGVENKALRVNELSTPLPIPRGSSETLSHIFECVV